MDGRCGRVEESAGEADGRREDDAESGCRGEARGRKRSRTDGQNTDDLLIALVRKERIPGECGEQGGREHAVDEEIQAIGQHDPFDHFCGSTHQERVARRLVDRADERRRHHQGERPQGELHRIRVARYEHRIEQPLD
jgi:hypothetical protein